ncbi:MAG: molybdate ABC transporter substrate-binding protein [Thiohalomonadales bacterium]
MKIIHIVKICCIALFLNAVSAQASPLLSQTTVGETELISQFHGDPINADLRLLMAGNQIVVMDLLIKEFQIQHPYIKKIFYVTLPPGKELQWILKGGIELHGENSFEKNGFMLKVQPDVYSSVSKGHMDKLNAAGIIDEFITYAHNRLVLMVKSDDPLAGSTLTAQQFYDLMSDPTVTISEPNILTQGIERHIWQMYTDTSKVIYPADTLIQGLNGKMFDPSQLAADPTNSLRRIVYLDKVAAGATDVVPIHHLTTPENLRLGNTRLGPVWTTEVLYQQNRLGATDISSVEIGDKGADGQFLDRREKVNYIATMTKGVMDKKHKLAAILFLTFLQSEAAQLIMESVGFIPATANELATSFKYPHID